MIELTILIISLAATFYFAGTETAFVSVNRVRIELWRRQKRKSAKIIARFLLAPEKFLYTTLVGNNLANVALASYATVYFGKYIGHNMTWLLVTVITVMIGEIIPKTLFRSMADVVIIRVAPILQFFYYVFLPLIWIISRISSAILSLTRHRTKEISDFFSKKDVEILIKESKEQISVEDVESKILRRILNLRMLKVRDAMIPRTDIVAVPETIPLEELIEVFQKTGFTKIPVFREDPDDIIGVVLVKDMFTKPESLRDIIRDVMFVPETKRSSKLLREFRRKNTTVAIVFDEYGGIAGLVTSEDLIEELVGEISDEFETPVIQIRKIDEQTYSVNGRIELQHLHDEVGIHLPPGDYDTLAGFLLNQLGHIPRRDETYSYHNIKFVITRATRRKIEWVRITLPVERNSGD